MSLDPRRLPQLLPECYVNAVSPALTQTPGTMENQMTAGMFDWIVQIQAIKRVGMPDDVAGMILFLASDAAEFVTGQTIVADGGLTYF